MGSCCCLARQNLKNSHSCNARKRLDRLYKFPCLAGLFMAPTMVGEAIKGGMLVRHVLSTEQHTVLDTCIVHTEAGKDGTVQMDTLPGALHLPGVAACMGSAEAALAMIGAVENSTCIVGAGVPHSEIVVATGGKDPSSPSNKSRSRSSEEGSARGQLARKIRVRPHACKSMIHVRAVFVPQQDLLSSVF